MKKKSASAAGGAASRVARQRAHRLIEQILREMQRGVRDPEYCKAPEWEKLFGPKQSMVANLQKLVSALVTLPPEEASRMQTSQNAESLGFSREDMQLLRAWVEERGADKPV